MPGPHLHAGRKSRSSAPRCMVALLGPRQAQTQGPTRSSPRFGDREANSGITRSRTTLLVREGLPMLETKTAAETMALFEGLLKLARPTFNETARPISFV